MSESRSAPSAPPSYDFPSEVWRSLVQQIPDSLLVVDSARRIVAFNEPCVRGYRLRYQAELRVGMNAGDVFPAGSPEQATFMALWDRALGGESLELIQEFAEDAAAFQLTLRPLHDPRGAIVGAFHVSRDVTAREQARGAEARKGAEQELIAREETIRRQLAEIEAIYDSAPTGMAVFDREMRFVRINEQMAQLNGVPRDAHLGHTVREVVPLVADAAEPLLRQVLDTGRPIRDIEIVGETPAQPGVTRYWLEHYYPVLLHSTGEVIGVNATADEITAAKREQLTRDFLSEASSVLASSLEYETTLSRIARLAIPFLADYCIVDVLQADGSIHRVAAKHVDPEMQPLLDVVLRFPPPPESMNPAARVIRTGRAEWTAHMDPSALPGLYEGREQVREIIEQLKPHSYVCVPMMTAGRVLGSILMIASCSSRRYGEADVEPALELGRRAGAAIFNAQLHAATERARHEAELASMTKSQFLATMSHELRTPLTGIIGYTELLDEQVSGPLTERQKMQLGRIKASAWHLVTIIDEILLFARVEAGREEVRRTVLDLSALVQESVGIMETHARAKQLTLTLDLPAQPLRAATDQGKVRQILLNLLGNALKFTDQGGVHVQLSHEGHAACVRVADTGPGIPEDQRQRVFEPFTQADGSNTRTKGGTGLGLTVSRRLAGLLGGSLDLESTSPEGSTFLLRLPLDAENALDDVP